MKGSKKHFSADDWEDFSHLGVSSAPDNRRLFASFEAFRTKFETVSRSELVERGWCKSRDEARSLDRLFFALDAERENVLFRKSATLDETLLAMWLSLVREKAQDVVLEFEAPPFEGLTKAELRSIAKLSVDIGTIRILPERLAEKGVILVYHRNLGGMKLDGAAFRIPSGHMVVGMTFRFTRLDYFWFTLMHELAHLVLHGNLLNEPVLIDVEEGDEVGEKAANKLARDSFVEKSSWRNCEPRYDGGNDAVVRYAREQGVHPSIVAGLLRREFRNYARYGQIIHEGEGK